MKYLILALALTSGASMACENIALDLIEMNEKDEKGKAVCLYKSRETGIDWAFPKKEMIEYRGRCPLVLLASDPLI